MSDETPKPDVRDEKNEDDGQSWKARTAAGVIVGTFALVAYVTIRTGTIPANVALPLLAAAAFGLWTFRWEDFIGRRK